MDRTVHNELPGPRQIAIGGSIGIRLSAWKQQPDNLDLRF